VRIAGLFSFLSVTLLSLFGQPAPAWAQSDCKALVAPSPFGPDDQTGATNRITPAVTKAAAADIQTGVVTAMAYPLTDGIPLFGTRFSKTVLTSFATMPGAEFGKNKLSYMEDTYLSQSHVGTHIDGIGHIGVQDCYYNQTPMGKYVTQNNLKRLGLENIKTFATRGVIIDAVKVFQEAGKLKANSACRRPCLDAGTMITEADSSRQRGGDAGLTFGGGEPSGFPSASAPLSKGGKRRRVAGRPLCGSAPRGRISAWHTDSADGSGSPRAGRARLGLRH